MKRTEPSGDPRQRQPLGGLARLRGRPATDAGDRALEVEQPSGEVVGLLDQRRAPEGGARRWAAGCQQRTRIRQRVEPLLGGALGRRDVAHELGRGARRQPVDGGRAAHRALQRGRRRRDLEGQRRRQLAPLDFALQRRRQSVQELQPGAEPGARPPERGRDLPGRVALLEEIPDQPRLLERAHGPADRVERQPVAGRRAVVQHPDDRGDHAPAKRQQRLVPQEPVDDLQPERRLAHEQGLA